MEIDKPHSSDKAKTNDEDYEIVLELSENDPHFDKKKKLLQNKGFNPKEQVFLKSSSCPDWISTTLKIMLPMARIIHLNEVELYFAEDDMCSPVEFYSPRNELEALNSVLSLLDIPLSGGKCVQMKVLQELRDAIVAMIHDFGHKNNVKATIMEIQSCHKEECLLQWAESKGMRTRLQIAYVEGAGRGAIAREDLNVGDIALEIPVSLVISEELVCISDMYGNWKMRCCVVKDDVITLGCLTVVLNDDDLKKYHILEKIDGISLETMLLLWSMKERHNCNSEFKFYFSTLPEKFNTGLSFGVEAIVALDGTLLFEEIMQAKEYLRAQYDELFPALCDDHPDTFPRELYTWEQFLWACELWYSNSMKVMFPDGKLRTCLIPVAGFLNHSLHPHILHFGKIDSATNSLKFRLSRPCSAGEQCFLSYGNFSSSHLITFYGFLPKGDNPYDVIPLGFGASEDDYAEGGHMSNSSTHMVRGTWLSNNHNIFYYGLPSPLLEYLRKAGSPMLQTKTYLQGNLENEMEVLENLSSTFDGMMERISDAELNDREEASWDVRLASEFKNLQRTIVSSIVTSCRTGLKLVENEWSRCMAEDKIG